MAPLRGELSPQVTEGWLSGCPCSWAHPSPPNGGAPLEGEPRLSKKCIVGAHSVRPGNLSAAQNCTGGYRIRPYANLKYLAPEGSIGEDVKSVKKRAALLHVLAFCFFDPLFGVPRGEQPLGRASRAIGSSGHLFRFLFGCPKRKD